MGRHDRFLGRLGSPGAAPLLSLVVRRRQPKANRGAVVDGEGRVAKQVGGRGYFAKVRVRLDPGGTAAVAVEPGAVGDYDRGLGWGEAAASGAALGMSLAGLSCACAITQVRGMVCDTSPALVALAAARAVWAAAGFAPPPALAGRVEACVPRGHSLSPDQLGSELLAGGCSPDAEPGAAPNSGQLGFQGDSRDVSREPLEE